MPRCSGDSGLTGSRRILGQTNFALRDAAIPVGWLAGKEVVDVALRLADEQRQLPMATLCHSECFVSYRELGSRVRRASRLVFNGWEMF